MTYGYARVSSRDQNLDRQLDALLKAKIERENIFTDKLSGNTSIVNLQCKLSVIHRKSIDLNKSVVYNKFDF